MARLSQPGARPLLACEISAGSVIAARCARKPPHVEMFSSRSLRPGVITPTLAGTNIQDAAALRTAIQDTLGPLSGKSRDVIAIIPDSAIRIMLLDFESLPEKPQERGPFIRFRLKKSLPFDVDHAALSWDVQSSNGRIQVVAAVSPGSVIGEYEAAFREAGYSPGVILPSSLASLGMVDVQYPTLLLKIDPLNITIAAAENNALRLIRTLDNPRGYEVTAAELTEAVLPSVVFFEDTSGKPIEQIVISGAASFREIAPVLQQQTGAAIQELLPRDSGQNISGDKIPPSLMAGVVGALLG